VLIDCVPDNSMNGTVGDLEGNKLVGVYTNPLGSRPRSIGQAPAPVVDGEADDAVVAQASSGIDARIRHVRVIPVYRNLGVDVTEFKRVGKYRRGPVTISPGDRVANAVAARGGQVIPTSRVDRRRH
jgi:hypothetical protein